MEAGNKCTVVMTGIFNEGGSEMEEFKEYSMKAAALTEANGGNVVSKNVVEKNLGNGNSPHVVIVMEFPSKEKAVDTFTSEEYTSLIPLRGMAFKEINILITK